jgi:hypothetical protein
VIGTPLLVEWRGFSLESAVKGLSASDSRRLLAVVEHNWNIDEATRKGGGVGGRYFVYIRDAIGDNVGDVVYDEVILP